MSNIIKSSLVILLTSFLANCTSVQIQPETKSKKFFSFQDQLKQEITTEKIPYKEDSQELFTDIKYFYDYIGLLRNNKYLTKEYRRHFLEVVVSNPNYKYADEALLRLGESFQNIGEYDKAFQTFDIITSFYDNSDFSPIFYEVKSKSAAEALYKKARITIEQHNDVFKGMGYLNEILVRFPDAEQINEKTKKYIKYLITDINLPKSKNIKEISLDELFNNNK